MSKWDWIFKPENLEAEQEARKDRELTPEQAASIDKAHNREPSKVKTRYLPPRGQ